MINTKLFRQVVQNYMLTMSMTVLFIACFDSVAPLPCGGSRVCSSPRICVEGECIFACTSDDDCQNDMQCERQVCVSQILAEIDDESSLDQSNFDLSISDDMMSFDLGTDAGVDIGVDAGVDADADAGPESE